tara:strand:+ start:2309 stop:2773 length:465 start_codon:yes stop_codon:yes gene_type:complete
MTKSDTIIQINSSWDNLLNTIALFSSKHERIPGAVGTWSFLEAVIHIFAWDNELLNNLKDYHDKKELPTWLDLNDVEVIELNQRQVDEYANDSFEDLYKHLLDNHSKLIEYLGDLPEELFDIDPFTSGMIKDETYLHYQEHNENIQIFLKTLNN